MMEDRRRTMTASFLTEGDPDDVVGHKTLRSDDGLSFRHEPLRRAEAAALWEASEVDRIKREADMPDDRAAIQALWQAYQRLKELGWREAVYCPKDGTEFEVIEPGSTGVHRCHYSGKWPNGSWEVGDGFDMGPSYPILFRLYPEDLAREDERRAAARARYKAECESDGE